MAVEELEQRSKRLGPRNQSPQNKIFMVSLVDLEMGSVNFKGTNELKYLKSIITPENKIDDLSSLIYSGFYDLH